MRSCACLLATLWLLSCNQPPTPPPATHPDAAAPIKPLRAPQPSAKPAEWTEIRQLTEKRQPQAALDRTLALLKTSQAAGQIDDWRDALIQAALLRARLGAVEDAVTELKAAPWPDDPLSRAMLTVTYAHLLDGYARTYTWEIRQREQVTSQQQKPSIRTFTAAEIAAAAQQAFDEAWQIRQGLGTAPLTWAAEIIEPNNYPKGVRDTLRDALSYLRAEILANPLWWDAEAENTHLPLAPLLGDLHDVQLLDDKIHPLTKIAAVLDDLERWHLSHGRREAALAARIERIRYLHAHIEDAADRKALRAELEQRLKEGQDLQVAALGQGVLAQLYQVDDAPDSLVKAHAAAVACRDRYKAGAAGGFCQGLAATIEQQELQMEAMLNDGVGRRAVMLTHKNLKAIHLRLYRLDLLQRFEKAQEDHRWSPDQEDVRELLRHGKPVTQWQQELPDLGDFRSHRTFVTPPVKAPGFYVLIGSLDPAFTVADDSSKEQNTIRAVPLLLSDLVLVKREDGRGGTALLALSGDSGTPVPGVTISLYRETYDSRRPYRQAGTLTTDQRGQATLPRGDDYLAVGRKGAEVTLYGRGLSSSREQREQPETSTLIYTDRSVYRPGQKLSWKIVVYRGRAAEGRFQVLPGTPVTVRLRDANYQEVGQRKVTTNRFGTASGEFVLPTGKLLGQWSLETSKEGQASVRVEEYKRPTFEAKLLDPTTPLHLGQQAALRGEARYYYGLPLTGGKVRWSVRRSPVFPPWWSGVSARMSWGSAFIVPAAIPQPIASGVTAVQADGKFEIRFVPKAPERVAPELARGLSYSYQVQADVTDESGETRSLTSAVRIGVSAIEARIANAEDRGFFTGADKVVLKIRRTDLNDAPRPGKGSYVLAPLQQPEHAVLPADRPLPAGPGGHTPGDLLRPRWEVQDEPALTLKQWPAGPDRGRGELTHDASGEALLDLGALPAGAYRVTYKTQDDSGVSFETTAEVLVVDSQGGSGDHKTAPPALPLLLLAREPAARSGGTAVLLATSGLPDQPLYLDRMRGGKLAETRRLEGPGLIELAVGEQDRGGFAVRLWTVRDHQLLSQEQTIAVPWTDRLLEVSFATFRDQLRPGARETFRVSVKGADPLALAKGAELLAYMYDRSLDLFAPHAPTDVASLYPTHLVLAELEGGLESVHEVGVASPVPQPPGEPPPHGDMFKLPYARYDVLGGSGFGEGTIGLGNLGTIGRGGGGLHMKRALAIAGATTGEEREAPSAELAKTKADAQPERKMAPPAARALADGHGGPSAPGAAVQLRENFAETAFFYPHLVLDQEGQAGIEFTVPDSVTSWSVWVLALTADLRGGLAHRETRSVKELVVRPQMPRFLREGDRAALKIVLSDASAKALSGEALLDIVDADDPDRASLAAEFGLAGGKPQRLPFSIAPGGSTTLTVPLQAPRRVATVAFRVSATAGDLSDGELRPLPVLPGRVHLSQSRFVTLRDSDQKSIHFADMAAGSDPSLQQDGLVVRVDAQLLYSVLAALPYLVRYPYECTEQTLNRFVSVGILAGLYRSEPALAKVARGLSGRKTELAGFDEPSPSRKVALEEAPWLEAAHGGRAQKDLEQGEKLLNLLAPGVVEGQRDSALGKLRKAQLPGGGFPWWSGGPADTYMTLYLLEGFARAAEFGVPAPRDMVQRGLAYLGRHVRQDLLKDMRAGKAGFETLTLLNYVLSSFPGPDQAAGGFPQELRGEILDYSFVHWKEHSRYLQGQLALTLQRLGRKADARAVLAALLEGAKTTDEQGTFFAPEERAWLWYQDTIETQSFALQALLEIQPQDPRADGLVKWLLLNKKMNQWKSTRATAEVIYSLVRYLKARGALAVREAATVTVGPRKVEYDFAPDKYTGGGNQLVIPAAEIDPKAMSTISIAKATKGLLFASATWTFSTDKMPTQEFGDFFSVSRHYFKREQRGQADVLIPLGEGGALKVGDEVEVQLSLRAKHAAEYVHLRDPRAAGMEPESLSSGYRYGAAAGYYEEVRDSGANYYFDRLPTGEYTFKYRLRASMAGTFRAGPATVQSMYAPEFNAYSTGATMAIQ